MTARISSKLWSIVISRVDDLRNDLRKSNPYILPPPLPNWYLATQTIVILDFGSQYRQLIARRIREQNAFSVVLPCAAPMAGIQPLKPPYLGGAFFTYLSNQRSIS